MNFRDRLKNKAIKTKDASIWNQFRKVKNQVNQENKSAKKTYYNNAFNNYASDQRKTWKTINELASRKSNKTLINEIQHQGQKSSSQVEGSELLNTFFIETGPSLSRNVTNGDIAYEEFLCATAKEFIFEETSSTHILCFISKLCKSKASSFDKISAKLLRECPYLIAESLTLTFNQSLLTGIFPDEWKSARVIPHCTKILENKMTPKTIDQYR